MRYRALFGKKIKSLSEYGPVLHMATEKKKKVQSTHGKVVNGNTPSKIGKVYLNFVC